MTMSRLSLREIKSSGKVSDNVILDDGSWVEEGSEVISSDPSKAVNLINTIVKGNSILCIDSGSLVNCEFDKAKVTLRGNDVVEFRDCKIKNKSDIFKVRGMNKAELNLRQRFYKVEMNNASITFPDGELLCNNLVMRDSSHIHLENPQDIIISDVVMDIDAEIEIEGNQNLTIANVDLREYSSLKIKTSGTKDAASVDNMIVIAWNTKTVKL
jgi:hypothetical protein|nr:MAG TPA: hypothetical protein [Caudoviricetes sp.]